MSRGLVKLPCITHGCPRYAEEGQSRCAEHQREHVKQRWENGATGQRGSQHQPRGMRDVVWREQRKRCGRCRKQVASFELHHIDGNARNNARSNLVCLCKGCHLAVEREKRRAR